MLICKKNSKVDYLGLIYRIEKISKNGILLKGQKHNPLLIPSLFCDELRLGNLKILEL